MKQKTHMGARSLPKSTVLGLLALAILTFALTAQAGNLVVNGDFETTTNGPNFQFDRNTVATGWTSTNNNNERLQLHLRSRSGGHDRRDRPIRRPEALGPGHGFEQWPAGRQPYGRQLRGCRRRLPERGDLADH